MMWSNLAAIAGNAAATTCHHYTFEAGERCDTGEVSLCTGPIQCGDRLECEIRGSEYEYARCYPRPSVLNGKSNRKLGDKCGPKNIENQRAPQCKGRRLVCSEAGVCIRKVDCPAVRCDVQPDSVFPLHYPFEKKYHCPYKLDCDSDELCDPRSGACVFNPNYDADSDDDTDADTDSSEECNVRDHQLPFRHKRNKGFTCEALKELGDVEITKLCARKNVRTHCAKTCSEKVPEYISNGKCIASESAATFDMSSVLSSRALEREKSTYKTCAWIEENDYCHEYFGPSVDPSIPTTCRECPVSCRRHVHCFGGRPFPGRT